MYIVTLVNTKQYIVTLLNARHTIVMQDNILEKSVKMFSWFNPLAVEFFLIPFSGHGDIVLQTFIWHGLFQCLLFGTAFSFVLMFLRPNHSTGFFKEENQEIQFPLLCTKPSKDKNKFCLSKVGNPGVNSSASRA